MFQPRDTCNCARLCALSSEQISWTSSQRHRGCFKMDVLQELQCPSQMKWHHWQQCMNEIFFLHLFSWLTTTARSQWAWGLIFNISRHVDVTGQHAALLELLAPLSPLCTQVESALSLSLTHMHIPKHTHSHTHIWWRQHYRKDWTV